MPLQETFGAASARGFGRNTTTRIPTYVEDVFSTYLYTGNGSTQTITNGIDLAGKGGLVWVKNRGAATNNLLFDTPRGTGTFLSSNLTNSATAYTGFGSFNLNGFSLNVDPGSAINASSNTYVSWTFRKQPKFFDVVTFTAPGVGTELTVNHNLGSAPGCVIMKSTTNTADWVVLHRYDQTKFGTLNNNAAFQDASFNASFTSTSFKVKGGFNITANSGTYVAYLFAHDAGGFGASGSDNVISCGSYTSNGNEQTINLGWEPQFLLVKNAGNSSTNWVLVDNMRGLFATTSSPMMQLRANSSAAEFNQNGFTINATGFTVLAGSNPDTNETGGYPFIYIAIRRGPMRTPTTGTSVFTPSTFSTSSGAAVAVASNSTVDLALLISNPVNQFHYFATRLIGNSATLRPTSTNVESTGATDIPTPTNSNAFTSAQNLFRIDGGNQTNWNASGSGTNAIGLFSRAPGVFDVVCYTGTGSATTVSHNLGAVPELMIVKRRDTAADWWVYDIATGNTKYQVLNSTATPTTSSTAWNNTTPTSSVFSVGTGTTVNASAGTYVAYLFATVAGVSKVGSYTGNGSSQTINCGFTGGSRFVMIKRTDSTGDWYVWDSARGIVAGNDPHLSLNTTAAEVTTDDSVDTDSTGFVVNQVAATNVNVSSATYIFLAVA